MIAPRRIRLALGALLFAISIASIPAFGATATLPKPPATKMEVVRDTLNGTVIADPYRWLENKDAPETRAWIASQNDYFHQVMDAVPGREPLKARLEQLLKTDDVGLPTEEGGRLFFLKRVAGQDQRILFMRKGPDGKDEVLLDPQPLSADHSVSVRLITVSHDGNLAVIGLQKGGEDEFAPSFLDVTTKKMRADQLPKARYFGIELTGDAKTVYYAKYNAEGPRVYRHTLGADAAKDEMIFGQGYGPGDIVGVDVSDDGAWLTIRVSHGSAADKVELYAMDLRKNGPIQTIVNDLNARFDGEVGGNTLYVRTNWNAPKNRIMAIDLEHPARDQWREVVKEGDNVIDSWTLAGGRIVVNYLVNVISQVILFDTSGKLLGPVPVGDAGSVGGMEGHWSAPDAFINFTSFNVPPRIQRVTTANNGVKLWWKQNIPFNGDDYEVRQVWYTSKDQTRIPMFIFCKKGLKLDGNNPVYLTGYGGFTVNELPRFSTNAALWVENGGVWALPNLRGGSEFGEAWHKAGMLANKQNVFDDFIAAAEYLILKHYTSTDRLAIAGGSNGGLLVGAAMTQRPELYRAVICAVPLIDMLRYQKFLVARFWVPEYGSAENPDQFPFIYAYSPYQHVKVGEKYPAVLLVSGDSDTRVDPLHARKMTALLQASTGSDLPVVLHYDTKSGHAGGKAVSQQIEDDADTMQFLFWQLGMTPNAAAQATPAAPAATAGSAR
jgi:prolyl oligopeptidase